MKNPRRYTLFTLALYAGFLLVIGRLFYWQVIKGDSLAAVASDQYQKTLSVKGSRGQIYTADNKLLVGNEQVYRVFAEPKLVTISSEELAQTLVPTIGEDLFEITNASSDAELDDIIDEEKVRISSRLEEKKESSWVGLYGKISQNTKEKIETLDIQGLGFEPYEVRMYPEASMAAHVTGFVGKSEDGHDLGYFGIEGALDKELQPRSEVERWERGLLGFTQKSSDAVESLDGRDVYLTIRRDLQTITEQHLEDAIKQYGAKAGEVIIMEPQTGFVLASASFPRYDQKKFFVYEQELYKNPIISLLYEPGSTFKPITVAAGIEAKSITPNTKCTRCDEAVKIDKYTIKTWNNQYNPDISITDGLAKSDNTAMVFIQQETDDDDFAQTIQDFGFGSQTTPDLQEDIITPFPQKLGPVELATISFGQGISTNSLQLVRAIGAIANGGSLMQPQFVARVEDHTTQEEIVAEPKKIRQAISRETAEKVTKMMVNAAEHGEAQWTASQTYTVAGKTGTAQIAVNGRYDPEKTIASFIGFTPANNPKYIMLVKLVEPQSSPWAAETAAPLWYDIAQEVNWLLGVTPDK
jgi:cell division protein FtsI/penicillin-binding protein 2